MAFVFRNTERNYFVIYMFDDLVRILLFLWHQNLWPRLCAMDPALRENSNVNPKCFALNPSTSITLFQTNIFPLFSGSCWPVLFLFFPHTLYFINYSPNPNLHTLTSRWILLTNSLLFHKYSFVYFLNWEDGVN